MSTNFDPMQTPLPPQKFQESLDRSKSSTLKIVLIVLGCIFVAGTLMIGLLIALLLPAVHQVREAARKATSQNQSRGLTLALHSYQDTKEEFPVAAVLADDGTALHSWRTLLLPELELQSIANSIELDKPWNDPANRSITDQHIAVFSSPRCQDSVNTNKTAFVAVVGPDTLIQEKVARHDIPDGFGNTAWLIELKQSDIAWAEPRDITIEKAIQVIQDPKSQGTIIAFADGAVRTIRSDISAAEIRKLFNCSDGVPSANTLSSNGR